MKKHKPSELALSESVDPMEVYRDKMVKVNELIDPIKDRNDKISSLMTSPDSFSHMESVAATSSLSAHMASLTATSGLSAHMASLTATSGLSAHMASLTATSGLSAHMASLTATSCLSAHMESVAATSSLSAHMESVAATSGLSAHMASLTAMPDLSAHIENVTAMSSLSANLANLTTMPDLSARMESLTVVPDLFARMASVAAMPDLSNRIAELSKMQDLDVHIATLSVVPHSMRDLHVSLDFLKNSVADANRAGLTIDEKGAIKLSSKELAVSELQELTVDVLQRSVEVNQSVESYINHLILEIKKQKDPLIQRLLSWLVFPLIVGLVLSVVTPISEHYVSAYLTNDTRAEIKNIKKNANNTITNPDLLNEMRFVNSPLLNVRMEPSTKSELIGALKFATPIVVIEKNKNWTLVEWVDEEKRISIKGWVFSRYLKKFR